MSEANRDGTVVLPFGDGRHTFRLAWDQLIMLQEARDMGPFLLLNNLFSGAWRVEDIAEVIRCGLIGGGKEPVAALQLVETYVHKRPPLETLVIAQKVLGAGLSGGGAEEDPGKNSEAANPDGGSPHSREGRSDLPPSSAPAP